MRYTLYYFPHNASLAPHMVMRHLGVDFELALVDRSNNWQKSAEYLKLNPAGRIPTLIDHQLEDLAVFESAAICVHLAENHSENSLIPAIGSRLRPQFHQWMMYLTNTFQADLMLYYYPGRHTTDEQGIDEVVAAAHLKVAADLAILNDQLAGKRYLLGDEISACDYYLLMLCMWAQDFKNCAQPPLSFPHIAAFMRHMLQLQPVITACEVEQIDLAGYQ